MKTKLLLSAALLGACAEPSAPAAPAAKPASAPASRPASSPEEALARLDSRTPVPLQPMMAWHQKQNMMAHLEALQAAAEADFDGVAKAAAPIGSSPSMRTMCEHMGKGAEGFTELALSFHEEADRIAEAARARDMPAVLSASAETVGVCTSCHARFRQHVVDAATWDEFTR